MSDFLESKFRNELRISGGNALIFCSECVNVYLCMGSNDLFYGKILGYFGVVLAFHGDFCFCMLKNILVLSIVCDWCCNLLFQG